MSNYLNPSSAFVVLVLAFGLFTGGTVFLGDLFEQHNVDQTQNLTVDKQYQSIQDKTNQLDQRVSTVTNSTNPLDTASAGILIVPNIVSLLTEPISIATETVGSLSASFDIIPNWLTTILSLLLTASIAFGIFRVLIGVSEI